MMVEIICIVVAKVLVVIFYPDRFVINLGFRGDAFVTWNIFTTLVVELAVELTVDGMAVSLVRSWSTNPETYSPPFSLHLYIYIYPYLPLCLVLYLSQNHHLHSPVAALLTINIGKMNKEVNKQHIPLHLYKTWLTKDIVISHIFTVINSVTYSFWGFITPASIFFCSSYDPCSCSGGPHDHYAPLCAFLAANLTAQAHANVSGFPGLPARYIIESGNGSFALNLAEFRDEYLNPIAVSLNSKSSARGGE